MMNISSLLSSMSEDDRHKFDMARASMQKTYMQVVTIFGGVNAMDTTDSMWMDAMDQRLAELMRRDGRDVPVILPMSSAVAATLPPASVTQILKEDPTGARAGDVPQDHASSVIAGLAKSTIEKGRVPLSTDPLPKDPDA